MTIATMFPFVVNVQTFCGSSAIACEMPSDARRVSHREVIACLDGGLRNDLDLPTKMRLERSVRDVNDLRADDPAHRGSDLLELACVSGEHRDVTNLRPWLYADQVDRAE